MDERYVYVSMMVEEYIDNNGERVTFQAAKRSDPSAVWGPPRRLDER